MRIEQQGIAMLCLDRCQFEGQPVVIRLPIEIPPLRDLDGIGYQIRQIDRLVVEAGRGAEFRVAGTGIQCLAGRRAVQIDDIARMGRLKDAGTEFVEKIIEQIDMPVGIRDPKPRWCHGSRQICRDMGPHMGHADQKRR